MTSAAIPNDSRKTRARLVSEVRFLRGQVADLEKILEQYRRRERTLPQDSPLLESALAASGVAIASLDGEFTFIRVNSVFASAFKKAPNFFQGKNYFDMFPRDSMHRIFLNALRHDKSLPFDFATGPRTGAGVKYRGSYQWRLFPVKAFSGAPEGLILCGIDVSEHLHMIKTLQERAGRLEESFEDSQRKTAETMALLESATAVLENPDFPAAARRIYSACKKLIGQTAGKILLLKDDASGGMLLVTDAPGCGLSKPLPLPQEVCDRMCQEKQRVRLNDFASQWPGVLPRGHIRLQNLLLVPLRLDSKIVGLIGLSNKEGGFTKQDARLAAVFGSHLEAAYRNSTDLDVIRASESEYRRLSEMLEAQMHEQEARMSQTENLAEIGQMISAVAHEIRNILHIIQMGSQALRQKIGDETGQRQILDEIDYGVDILKTLGNELLDYSKPIKLQKEPCSIKEAVGNALTTLGSNLQVKLALDLRNPNTHISVDKTKFTRVLLNVISNAIEAMPKGGKLTISSRCSTREGKRTASLSISDTGCGIPEDALEFVQQPFITTKEHGAGLGISICKKIISAHKGTFQIKSKVNKGTTVEILLPID